MVQNKPLERWAKLAQESNLCVQLKGAKHSLVIQSTRVQCKEVPGCVYPVIE